MPAAKVRPSPPVGVRRERLLRPLLEDGSKVWLVDGFAGCGKTTVLAHAAQAWSGRVVWVTADGTDRVGTRFPRVLRAAVDNGLPATSSGRGDDYEGADAVFQVIEALEASPEPVLVVVDDAHELGGAPSAETLDLLCRYRPAQVTLLLGVRHLRGLDHWRWRSWGEVRELDSASLRFRLWEVDTLFREHYRAPLSSGELQRVSQLTDGWAVALHLFHVATRTLPPAERYRLVTGPRLTVRSIRDYLADQVLATVEVADRVLLRRSAVLDRIRPDRCERLLARDGTGPQLQRLAQLGLLLPDADGITYRLHDLLRAHLLGELDDELGTGGVAGLHRLAADVLEAEGDLAEAVRAFGRGGDWDGVRRLLCQDGGSVVISGPWADDVPPELRDTDPWVLRAIGRRQLGEGDLAGARSTLAACVERFRDHGGDRQAERRLHQLEGWLHPDPGQQRSWTECLRAALAGDVVASWPDEPAGWLAEGLAALAVGRVSRAEEVLPRAAAMSGELGTVADLGLCLAAALSGRETPVAPPPNLRLAGTLGLAGARVAGAADGGGGGAVGERAVGRARGSGAPALVAVAESLAAFVAGEVVAPDLQAAAARDRGDQVGEAVHWLIGGLALLRSGGDAEAPLRLAAERFQALGLTVVAVLARSAASLAAARRSAGRGGDGGVDVAAARAVGPLPHALALLAQNAATGDPSLALQACGLASQHGFEGLLSGLHAVVADDPQPGSAALEVRCMGELRVELDGIERDVQQLRPRHQELLGILAAHPNTWLHRERLFAWLWPDASVDRATRNLQVAISAVRRLVEPDAEPGQPTVIVRSGERYRLAVDPLHSDIGRLEAGLAAARTSVRDGDADTAAEHLERSLGEWTGEPAAWSGPVDWAVDLRRQLAHSVGTVAVAVVEALRERGDPDRATRLAALALEVEPLEHRLWQLAVSTADEIGASVLASDLERRYRQLAG